jgi:hypothetical protein
MGCMARNPKVLTITETMLTLKSQKVTTDLLDTQNQKWLLLKV